ncbi:SAM-dependent methyltransferase [Nonomuraea aridisoli]|uniref:Methyltransferase n=1 Tax=Nonomuraea aridisoli TaxID=2070368 RepID=A0A2W2EPQ5_9ACTN|nr:class I SAM-dependent methyltransferase [Nonomuraea aridisoli]PZG18729.1 methyltransferase [Nonomuraea aridisoli]
MDERKQGPVTREALFAVMQAYKNTSLLRTGIELGVFPLLTEPASAETVAVAAGAEPRGMRILLNALAALKLVEARDHRYWLAPGVDDLLIPSRPGYVGDMIHVFASDFEWDALKRLPEAVRKGGTVMDQHAETPEYSYWEDFAAYAPIVAKPTAQVLADALSPWAGDRTNLDVLDMASGHGVYGATVAQRFPQARVWALDWANVLPFAQEQAEHAGVGDRLSLIAGDMFEVPLGGPYDVVLITNVLHHFSPERATELLTRARSVLKPDGRLGLVGFTTTDAPPGEEPAAHLFSVLMLAWTSEGEVHSEATYGEMLQRAGFGPAVRHAVPGLPFRVLTAAPV